MTPSARSVHHSDGSPAGVREMLWLMEGPGFRDHIAVVITGIAHADDQQIVELAADEIIQPFHVAWSISIPAERRRKSLTRL